MHINCKWISINFPWYKEMNWNPFIEAWRAGTKSMSMGMASVRLTHWGRVTHKCVIKLTIIGSDNGLSPGRRQAIIWTNDGILLIGPLETNFSEILIKIYTFSFKKMRLKMSSGKWRPVCLGLNVLNQWGLMLHIYAYIWIIMNSGCGLAHVQRRAKKTNKCWMVAKWTIRSKS